MQKVSLVFTDNSDGTVGISMEFDPPMKGNEKVTPAVGLAFDALEFLQRQNPGASEKEV